MVQRPRRVNTSRGRMFLDDAGAPSGRAYMLCAQSLFPQLPTPGHDAARARSRAANDIATGAT